MQPKITGIPRFKRTPTPKKSAKDGVQFLNLILDLPLKLSAIGLVFGAFVVYKYLKGMGFENLFTSILGSQNILLAIIFGFALIVLFISMMFVIVPWMQWQIKTNLKDKHADGLISVVAMGIFAIIVQQQAH